MLPPPQYWRPQITFTLGGRGIFLSLRSFCRRLDLLFPGRRNLRPHPVVYVLRRTCTRSENCVREFICSIRDSSSPSRSPFRRSGVYPPPYGPFLCRLTPVTRRLPRGFNFLDVGLYPDSAATASCDFSSSSAFPSGLQSASSLWVRDLFFFGHGFFSSTGQVRRFFFIRTVPSDVFCYV